VATQLNSNEDALTGRLEVKLGLESDTVLNAKENSGAEWESWSCISPEVLEFLCKPERSAEAVERLFKSEPGWIITTACLKCGRSATGRLGPEAAIKAFAELRKRGGKCICNRCSGYTSETDLFIELYLKDERSLSRYSDEDFVEMAEKFGKTDKDAVSKHIKSLVYKTFLETKYWKIVGVHVKQIKGSHCSVCPSCDHIDVHHRTYEHHGMEIVFWESDLTPLCHRCHETFHSIPPQSSFS
jgi:hypothetical protein